MNVNVKENIYFSVFHGSAGGKGESSFMPLLRGVGEGVASTLILKYMIFRYMFLTEVLN